MDNEIQIGSKSVKPTDIKQISVARNLQLIGEKTGPLLTFDSFKIECYDKDLLSGENLDELNVDDLVAFARQHPQIQLIEDDPELAGFLKRRFE